MKVTQSCLTHSLGPHGLYSPWNSPGQNTGMGSLSLLQGIFPIQGLNPGLLHCRWILYQLSHKGSPQSVKSEDYLLCAWWIILGIQWKPCHYTLVSAQGLLGACGGGGWRGRQSLRGPRPLQEGDRCSSFSSLGNTWRPALTRQVPAILPLQCYPSPTFVLRWVG